MLRVSTPNFCQNGGGKGATHLVEPCHGAPERGQGAFAARDAVVGLEDVVGARVAGGEFLDANLRLEVALFELGRGGHGGGCTGWEGRGGESVCMWSIYGVCSLLLATDLTRAQLSATR